jgi:FkbM family methyltransferase
MWVVESNPFDHFVNEIQHYSKIYKENCKDFKVAVQAGGHMGMFPRILGEMFETVYTFEPDSLSFYCLANNCQKKNIIKFNTALGNNGPLMYQSHYYYGNAGMNNYSVLTPNVEPVTEYFDRDYRKEPAIVNIPQVRLDDLNLSGCDLIHLDMEGNEKFAFDGMINTITKYRPFILFESGPTRETMDYFESLGYEKVYNPGDSSWICNA